VTGSCHLLLSLQSKRSLSLSLLCESVSICGTNKQSSSSKLQLHCL